ncbi:MAG: VCBS repeat-containing protein, partial [Myxococcota bacterium]|nr:VCBS repeat-containing protein [Myxococcota bacterium]
RSPGNDECLRNQCIATWGACTVHDDCELDEFCELSSRRCVKAADDPNQCIYIPPVGVFTPEEQWYWTSSSQFPTYRQVMMTPIVLNLTDDNGDGQIDEEDVPDVVFGCFAGSGYNNAGAIRVVSGDDGRELAASMEQPFSVRSDIGAADLDGDGYAEIVVSSANTANPKKLYFLNLLPDGGTGYTLQVKKTLTMDAKFNGAAGITTAAFADLDGDGSIEVVTQYGVTDGATLTHRCDAPSSWSFPVVADLDEDGSMEIIANGSIYDNNCQPLVGGASGYAAVADLVADAGADDLVPEIVWVRGGYTGNIALFNVSKDPGSGAWSMNLVWQTPIPLNAQRILQVYGITCPQTHSACNTGGGPPTIADFDGDGQPEISTAGRWYYIVLETDGSILWADGATRDYSSAATGSSVFDFEGDGAAEVVYNDEITLRVYKGAGSGVDNDGDGFADPEVLFSTANGSGTLFEYPLIVDVDNDGNAEIVVAANNYAYGTHTGIRVFRDPLDNWVRTRRIWNQHTYHVTNINEDGSVPTPESFNWRRASLNNFRQNVQPGGLFNAPNLTISTLSSSNAGCPATVHLHATVENTGSLGVGAGVWVGFYAVDLPGSDSRALLARVQLPNALPPGSAQVLTFVWDYSATLLPSMTPTNLVLPQHLKAVVDDPPASLPNGETNECHEDDNESPVLDLRICQ